MLKDVWILLTTKWDFFGKLLLEHIEISIAAILIAIVFGGLVGILISEYQKSAKPTLGVINFLYTIPSISMLGFLIPFSGIGNATAVIALTIYALLPMVRNLLRANKKNPYHYEIRVAATSLADLNTALAYADGVLLD